MPKGKTKKFIDKKNSVTFHLVHRSQQDPLITDENAPQRVLVPVDNEKHDKSDSGKNSLRQKKKEEQEKYGIFFDDDYDYLQHLKDVSQLPVEWERVDEPSNSKKDGKDPPKINLPSSVFASAVEEEVGLLNKAAPVSGPRLDFDPDIVAAMDDDFDFEDPDNQLEDDFIQLANADGSGCFNEEDEDEYYWDASSGHFCDSEEERDEVGDLDGPRCQFDEEETKSRFTEYSMSSSVIRRNEQLTLVDEKFERMYAAYDEEQIGALDGEEIEGYVPDDSEYILQAAKDFQKQQEGSKVSISELMKDRLKIIDSYSDSEEELEQVEVDERIRNKWDCESILSTHSNLYNHPKLLEEPKRVKKIKIDKRTGIPKDVLGEQPGKLTAKNLARLGLENEGERNPSAATRSIAETEKTYYSMISTRAKNETSEERKARHKQLKTYRKIRREERKENKLAFKEEKKCQEKILLNNNRNKFRAPNTIHV